ncbi:MAG: hypothetical protein ACLFVU_01590 [Phycisphaerae bacterium]
MSRELILLPLLALCLFGCSLGDERDEGDFRDDAARAQFVQQYCPARVPTGTTGFDFRYRAFQDYHLKGTFILPEGTVDEFRSDLGLEAGQNDYEDENPGSKVCRIRIDAPTRTVHIEAFSM